MQGQKSHIKPHGGGWFNRELKIFVLLLGLISFSNLIFSNNTFALFTPTLSASVDNTAVSVNGNQVINSTNKTTEIPLNLTVNTNNKTGYTATLSSETENTALTNVTSSSGAKINSISSAGPLGGFSNNTWGYKFGASMNYAPIPALSTPAQILQTTGKTNGNDTNSIKIGMKLGDNLESGNYNNKLIFSILTNNYEQIAIMTEGWDFNVKLKSLETATSKIEHFKKSTVAPATSMNAVNIEDEASDYEIKLWFNPTDKTAYYYAETEKVYLNNDSRGTFYLADNLTTLDLSNFDTSQVTDMSYMFYWMSRLTALDVSNFDTSKATNMNKMFSRTDKLITLDLSNFDTSQVTDMSYMFDDADNLTTLDLSNFDTSKVTNMDHMFSNTYNLTTLDLSNFNTSKVTNMDSMFFTSGLTSLNLSSFNTSKVTNMDRMFSNTYNLTTLDLSNFDTSKVTNMDHMFSNTYNLTTLDLSNFNTSKVTNMDSMFFTSGLTSLNLSSFNTSKVTDMSYMFYDMRNLTSLDLSNFDTSKVTSMDFMFALYDEDISKDKLERIYVNNDFNTTKLTDFSRMFKNRKKLRGGNGSYLANPSTADKTWLRVDRPGVQGYFTRKP